MTIQEKQLILGLTLKKISKEEFIKSYDHDLSQEGDYILSLLHNAYEQQKAEDIEYGLMLLPLDDFWKSNKYVSILNKLLVVSWHFNHEDIAALLQGIKSAESVNALYEGAMKNYDYLDYDETYQLARKCIKALADIGNSVAVDKLNLLAESDTPAIRQYAQKELKNRG